MNSLLGKGIYTLSDAARLTGQSRSGVYRWFREDGGFLKSGMEPIDGRSAVSFLDLIDLYVAKELRRQQVPLRELREAYRQLQSDLNTAHPFSHRDLFISGGKVFVEVARRPGLKSLYHVVSGQHFIDEIMKPHLRGIDYGKVSRLAEAWNIAPDVVINPGVSLGRPVAKGTGTATRVLFDAWRANGGDARLVSGLYELPESVVRNAVTFEEELRGRKAA